MLTQSDFEKLLNDLLTHRTEAAYFDCKEDLPLDSEGEKASFIRDVAALANNVIVSYLVIGIQDETWAEIGLPMESPLLDAGQTQSRMNQILENKLDPQLSIRYQIIELHGKMFGIVNIKGNHAPYIIAITDAQYGGNKTKGKPSFILRGVFYIRQGDTTVISNRQSRILEIQNKINTTISSGDKNQQSQDFLSKNAYLDVESPEFGRNVLSKGLIEKRWSEEGNIIVPAQSWVSIFFYPIDEPCKFDLNAILRKLQLGERNSRDDLWFHDLPRPISEMFASASSTPRGFIGKWSRDRESNPDQYMQAINILPTGIIHFAATYPLFYQKNTIRFYASVRLIGYLWQLIYLTKDIYKNGECNSRILLKLNFSGTKGTLLADLAKGPEKKWISAFDWEYNEDPRNVCQEINFQISRELAITTDSDGQIESSIRDIAKEIGQYYNQPEARCFTPDTNEFPVRQFSLVNN